MRNHRRVQNVTEFMDEPQIVDRSRANFQCRPSTLRENILKLQEITNFESYLHVLGIIVFIILLENIFPQSFI